MKSLFQKAKKLYNGYKLAKAYVDAVLDLPPTYTIGEIGGFEQIVHDPENFGSIERKIDAANKAEKAWLDFCEKEFRKK